MNRVRKSLTLAAAAWIILGAVAMPAAAQPRPSGAPSAVGAQAAALEREADRLMQSGDYARAEPLYRRSIGMRRNAGGLERQQTGPALIKLTTLLRLVGKYAAAEKLAKATLASREAELGPDHPGVAVSLSSLGELYRIQGRYKEAEALLKRSLAIREQKLGPEDAATADTLLSLGILYIAVGRFNEAETALNRSLAIGQQKPGPDSNRIFVQSLIRIGELRTNEMRYDEAESFLLRVLQQRDANNLAVAGALSVLGTVYRFQARWHEAEDALRRSLTLREQALGLDHLDVALSLANLGYFYVVRYRYEEARSLLERALAIREKVLGSDNRDVAYTLGYLGDAERRAGRLPEAERLYQRSLAAYQKALEPDYPAQDLSLRGLAQVYEAQGKFTLADPLLRRAIAIDEKAYGPSNKQLILDLVELGNFYRLQGRNEQAAAEYRRSLTMAEAVLGADHRDLLYPLRALANTERLLGHLPESLALFRRATSVWRARLATSQQQDADDAAAGEQADFRAIFLGHAGLAFAAASAGNGPARELWAEAFEAAQLAASTDVAKALSGTAARFAAGSDALAEAVRRREDAVLTARRLDRALLTFAGRPVAERDAAGEANLRRQLQQANESLRTLDAGLRQRFPQYAELTSPQPVPVAAVQSLLRPSEALLAYAFGAERSWLWVIKHDDFRMLPLDINPQQLAEAVSLLRSRLDPELNPELRPFPAGESYRLYGKLLAPAAALLADVRQVLLVPDGALESLPVGVLVSAPPAREPQTLADHRDIAWFARDHAVTVLPSVGALRALRSFTATAQQRKPFLGIGNPLLGPSGRTVRGKEIAGLFRGAVADVAKLRELPSLPETADELQRIAGILGADRNDLLLGPRATEPLVRKAALDRYRVIEFATHGLLSGEIEGLGEPALVLTPPDAATPENDGLLTASKIATLKLAADWVVLSACNTAIGDPQAPGLSGLAQAFFYAGARSLLVSNWAVASEPTVRLTTTAFSALARDRAIGQAEAMQRAMVAMLAPDNPPEYAHPMIWAPFVVIGEGRAGE